MSGSEAALYAQVLPVFLLALIAAQALWRPSPLAGRFNPMWLFSIAIAIGAIAAWAALTAGDDGAGVVRAVVIRTGANICIGMTAVCAIAEPFGDSLYRRALARRERKKTSDLDDA